VIVESMHFPFIMPTNNQWSRMHLQRKHKFKETLSELVFQKMIHNGFRRVEPNENVTLRFVTYRKPPIPQWGLYTKAIWLWKQALKEHGFINETAEATVKVNRAEGTEYTIVERILK